jgi:tetratricopeptide (TPR) repeat protein
VTDCFLALLGLLVIGWVIVRYRNQRKYKGAVAAFRQAIKLKPDDPEAWYNLGSTYARYGKKDDADAAFQQAIKLKPGYPEAWRMLGQSYLIDHTYDDAIAAYWEALKAKPDYADAWYCLGLVYMMTGKLAEARDALDHLRRLDPLLASKLSGGGRILKAVDETDNEARTLPTQSSLAETIIDPLERAVAASASLDLGDSYRDQGKYEQAVAAYRKAIKLRPDFVAAWLCLGTSYGEQGKHYDAVEALRQVVKLKPDYPEGWCDLALHYRELGKREQEKYDDAVAASLQAIKLKPDYSDAWFNLGAAYGGRGKRSEALDALDHLRKLDPSWADKLAGILSRK